MEVLEGPFEAVKSSQAKPGQAWPKLVVVNNEQVAGGATAVWWTGCVGVALVPRPEAPPLRFSGPATRLARYLALLTD
jgi:hypothetical protein